MKNLFLLLLPFCLSLLSYGQTPKTISYQGVARNSTGQPIPNQSIKIKLSLLETATSANSLYTETHTPTTTGQGLFAVQIGAGTVLSGTYANLDWSNGPKFVKTEIDPTGGDNFTLSSTNPLNAVPFALFAASGTPGPRGLKGDTGATGPQGPIGLTGSQGIKGDTGVRGPIGPQGIAGTNGKTILNGITKPAISIGTVGDFYINTASDTLYGPKTAVGWGTGISLVGPKGSFPNGTNQGDMQYWDGSQWIMIPLGQPGQSLKVCEGIVTWLPCRPSILTKIITGITNLSADGGGIIISDGGSPILSKGVCWSTSPSPTLNNSYSSDGQGSNPFISLLTPLTGNTTYYVRAYATNAVGTSYGNEQTFISGIASGGVIPGNNFCAGKFISVSNCGGLDHISYNGHNYELVEIGGQCWFKDNLRTTKLNDGQNLVKESNAANWMNSPNSLVGWYNNDSLTNSPIFGALYNFNAVSSSKLCPVGWHVPTDCEWMFLESFLGMSVSDQVRDNGGRGMAENIGGKMKEPGLNHWVAPNAGATNSTNFTGLPGGMRAADSGGDFNLGNFGLWWTSSETSDANAQFRTLRYEYGGIFRESPAPKWLGMSIRCIKD